MDCSLRTGTKIVRYIYIPFDSDLAEYLMTLAPSARDHEMFRSGPIHRNVISTPDYEYTIRVCVESTRCSLHTDKRAKVSRCSAVSLKHSRYNLSILCWHAQLFFVLARTAGQQE
jgi:hypothetical protein